MEIAVKIPINIIFFKTLLDSIEDYCRDENVDPLDFIVQIVCLNDEKYLSIKKREENEVDKV